MRYILFLLILLAGCVTIPTPDSQINQTSMQTFVEGELVAFSLDSFVDPDGDNITITFSEPINASGEWQTTIGDAGTYNISVFASDGTLTTRRDFTIEILAANQPPQITNFEDFTIKEGETVILQPEVSDPDGDDITLKYSGWLSSIPYQTTYSDAGEHNVTLTVSDGLQNVSETITITVTDVNRLPIIEVPAEITVQEGEDVFVAPQVVDPDGDTVVVEFSKPLNKNGQWTTQKGDAGNYAVKITASDSQSQITATTQIRVVEQNQPPNITISNLTIKEGELLDITQYVSDPDNDTLDIIVQGWITNTTYNVTYQDAGVHTINVTATDNIDYVEQQITITVENVNRAPIFSGEIFK